MKAGDKIAVEEKALDDAKLREQLQLEDRLSRIIAAWATNGPSPETAQLVDGGSRVTNLPALERYAAVLALATRLRAELRQRELLRLATPDLLRRLDAFSADLDEAVAGTGLERA
jgi:hypothetical protein